MHEKDISPDIYIHTTDNCQYNLYSTITKSLYNLTDSGVGDGEEQDVGGADVLQAVHDHRGLLHLHQGRHRHR